MNTGANGQEFDVAAVKYKLIADACNTDAAVFARFYYHALVGFEAAFMDNAGDLRYLTAGQSLESGSKAANDADGENAITNYKIAGLQSLLVKAVHLISGKPSHNRHLSHPPIMRSLSHRANAAPYLLAENLLR